MAKNICILVAAATLAGSVLAGAFVLRGAFKELKTASAQPTTEKPQDGTNEPPRDVPNPVLDEFRRPRPIPDERPVIDDKAPKDVRNPALDPYRKPVEQKQEPPVPGLHVNPASRGGGQVPGKDFNPAADQNGARLIPGLHLDPARQKKAAPAVPGLDFKP
jgi:hypothetical protein